MKTAKFWPHIWWVFFINHLHSHKIILFFLQLEKNIRSSQLNGSTTYILGFIVQLICGFFPGKLNISFLSKHYVQADRQSLEHQDDTLALPQDSN